MANINFNAFEKWTEDVVRKKWIGIVSIHKSNQLKPVKQYSSLKRSNFTKYPTQFNTKTLTPQVTRTYGSFGSGVIGAINGWKNKDESWRMLNVLTHDRQLHQRHGRTLGKATHKLEGSTQKLRRELRGLK